MSEFTDQLEQEETIIKTWIEGQIHHTSLKESSSSGSNFIAFSANNEVLGSISTKDPTKLYLWDLPTGEFSTLSSTKFTSIAFSPVSGSFFAACSFDRGVEVLDIRGGGEMLEVLTHPGLVNSVTFSPDRKILASCSDDQIVRLWDTTTWKLIQTLIGHTGDINTVAFSPDGRILGSCSFDDKTIRLWDVPPGGNVRTLNDSQGSDRIVFNPNGKIFASCGDGKVRLWDVAKGQVIQTLEANSDIHAIAFSPDGQTLVGGGMNIIHLWDGVRGQILYTFETSINGDDWVTSVAFSPDGQTLAIAYQLSGVVLWSVAHFLPILFFIRQLQKVRDSLLAKARERQEAAEEPEKVAQDYDNWDTISYLFGLKKASEKTDSEPNETPNTEAIDNWEALRSLFQLPGDKVSKTASKSS